MDSDFLLIRRMRKGENAAFEQFVRKYYQQIYQYCTYHCSDNEYAKDLTQETFLRFFEKLSNYHHKGKTKNYLYTISKNLCKDYYKKIKEIPVDNIPDTGDNQAENILNKLMVEKALQDLPEEYREVIILYYFQELKQLEIADILGIGLPLVKYRIKRGKEFMTKLMEGENL